MGEHLPYKQRVTGSSPVLSTKKVKGTMFDKQKARARTLANMRSIFDKLLATLPCTFHQEDNSLHNVYRDGLVAQLVRALACHARGRGFEPHPSRQPDMPL